MWFTVLKQNKTKLAKQTHQVMESDHQEKNVIMKTRRKVTMGASPQVCMCHLQCRKPICGTANLTRDPGVKK